MSLISLTYSLFPSPLPVYFIYFVLSLLVIDNFVPDIPPLFSFYFFFFLLIISFLFNLLPAVKKLNLKKTLLSNSTNGVFHLSIALQQTTPRHSGLNNNYFIMILWVRIWAAFHVILAGMESCILLVSGLGEKV